jgi:hypothetical protein
VPLTLPAASRVQPGGYKNITEKIVMGEKGRERQGFAA